MVVAPKKAGTVRIFVDVKALNESVLRETHPIPEVDDTVAQLTGTAVFSKLNANRLGSLVLQSCFRKE